MWVKRKEDNMSAFYVGNKSLSMITDIIVRYLDDGWNSFGFYLPSELTDMFDGKSEAEIFAALRQMNIDALEAKYSDNAAELYDDEGYEEGNDIWQPREYGVDYWHFQLLKSVQCYVYQCSEGRVPETELYKGMHKLENAIAMYIACGQPEYGKAEWR